MRPRREAWRAVWRDAPRHRSPNAGYPEAAMAGALGLSLAGPRVYGGVSVDDAMMGDGRRDADAADIRRALALYRRADAILIALLAVMCRACSSRQFEQAIEIEMRGKMRGERVERSLDQRVIGDVRRARRRSGASHAARCRSSANRPWI